MFLVEMVKERADIIHETHLTPPQEHEMKQDYFTPNYSTSKGFKL